MTRILFVDDEQQVLDGLRRILRSRLRDWEMEFVSDPFAVLPMFNEQPFEIVVSDMMMPGMDGLSLLRVVKAQYPETIRIVLSGQVDTESAVELIGVAHQYLSKPCDPDLIVDVIRRAMELKAMLGPVPLTRLVAGLSNLPSVPALYMKLLQLVKSPESSLADIADVMTADTAMTAKVLQLVNSAFFGLRRTVTDPRQAVTFLGLDNIATLALGSHVFTQMESAGKAGLSLEREHDRAIAVASATAAIAELENVAQADRPPFMLGGMLHDVGKLVLGSNFPDRYRGVVSVGQAIQRCKAERDEFGSDHSPVGAYLLGVWGLPDGIVEAVAHHHTPSASSIRRLSPLTVVHVVDALVDASDGDPALDLEYLEGCGVAERVDEWIDVAEPILDDILGRGEEKEIA